jgi:N12 class adenine-specific DNA methylase
VRLAGALYGVFHHVVERLEVAQHFVEAVGRKLSRKAGIRSADTRSLNRTFAVGPISKLMSVP